jgi:chloramphenicol 3-O phosphotransferase
MGHIEGCGARRTPAAAPDATGRAFGHDGGVVDAGRVVVLNGTSSAGKSSLAREFQQLRAFRGECWVVFGIDDFLPKLPGRWVEIDQWKGPLSEDGVRLERDGDCARYHIGELGRRLLVAYRRSIAEVARSGMNVVVDDVMIEHNEWDQWRNALTGLDAVFVAVRCDVEVAVQRETDRADRPRGLARGQAESVHRFPRYDFEVDTTIEPAGEVARRLDAHLGGAEPPAG